MKRAMKPIDQSMVSDSSYLKAFIDRGSAYLWPGASANRHEDPGSVSNEAHYQSRSMCSNSVIVQQHDIETGRFGNKNDETPKS